MDHVITVRDIVWPALCILAALGVLGLIVFVLSIFADAFKD